MRSRYRIWVIGLGLLCGGGCGLAEQSINVASYKINQRIQEHEERAATALADEAWQAVCAARPDLAKSADYAAGFKDGFAEDVWRGGTGEPPPMPPLKYRDIRYQTPSGYQAIEAWFSGYRQGGQGGTAGRLSRPGHRPVLAAQAAGTLPAAGGALASLDRDGPGESRSGAGASHSASGASASSSCARK